MTSLRFLAAVVLCRVAPLWLSAQTPMRIDHTLDENNGIHLAIRRIVSDKAVLPKRVILLLHGGGSGAISSFDFNSGGKHSFGEELSTKGFIVYLMNVRGWENSTAPAYDSTDTNLVAGSCKEAAADIDAAINYIREKEHVEKVNLFWWATGGHWVSYYTTLHNDKVDHLIVLNTLYGVKDPWSLNSAFADPSDSNRYNIHIPVYRESSKEAVIASRFNAVPFPDKRAWLDSSAVEKYAEFATSYNDRHVLRVPGGYRRESFNMAHGYQYWNARDIHIPTLIVRSQYDFWSRPVDVTAFYNDLVNTPIRKAIELPNATHFVFLDHATQGGTELVDAIDRFIPRAGSGH